VDPCALDSIGIIFKALRNRALLENYIDFYKNSTEKNVIDSSVKV
jgi:hypothetical protein